MRRIVYEGSGFEVLHTKLPVRNGEPVEARIVRFVDMDTNTIHDFPLLKEQWEQLVEMGAAERASEPLKDFTVVKAMPDVLSRRPQPGPRQPPR